MRSDLVDLDCEKIAETPKALLLKFDENLEVWFPKSQVEYEDGVVTMSEKLAIEKGVA